MIGGTIGNLLWLAKDQARNGEWDEAHKSLLATLAHAKSDFARFTLKFWIAACKCRIEWWNTYSRPYRRY